MDVTLYDFPESICCQMTRVVLAEKGVDYRKRKVDIRGSRSEQFEPWYLELNPKGVVPTLQVDGEVITDTLKITPYIDGKFDGRPLLPDDDGLTLDWMGRIIAPHYGVLLYGGLIDENGECETVKVRHRHLVEIRDRDSDPTGLLQKRIDGNLRFQAVLADPAQVEQHTARARAIVLEMEEALAHTSFVAGETHSIADCFAAAALARFELHGLQRWWENGTAPAVESYYHRLQERPSWTAAGVTNRDMHYEG